MWSQCRLREPGESAARADARGRETVPSSSSARDRASLSRPAAACMQQQQQHLPENVPRGALQVHLNALHLRIARNTLCALVAFFPLDLRGFLYSRDARDVYGFLGIADRGGRVLVGFCWMLRVEIDEERWGYLGVPRWPVAFNTISPIRMLVLLRVNFDAGVL